MRGLCFGLKLILFTDKLCLSMESRSDSQLIVDYLVGDI